jgi:ribosomal protein S21
MRVEVHNNNIDRALRVLGKKLKNENFWEEYRRKAHFEKPSLIRRRKKLKKKLG